MSSEPRILEKIINPDNFIYNSKNGKIIPKDFRNYIYLFQ